MRALKIFAALAMITPTLFALTTSAAAGQGQDACATGFTSVGCEITVGSDTPGGGAPTEVTCDPTDALPCWVTECETHIDNDASRAGVAWNGDPTQAPVDTDLVAFTDTAALDDYAVRYVGGGTTGWYSETGQWWQCTDRDAELDVSVRYLTIGPAGTTYGPTGPIIDVNGLRDAAEAAADPGAPPVVKSTPDGVASIVQVPTWFWIEPSWWTTNTGTATSTSGRMTVTVNATPADSVWETGEGTITTCGAGLPFTSGVTDPDLAGLGVCSWTYRHSSGWVGHFYRAEATVRSELDWNMTFNNGAVFDQGTLPDLFTTDGFDIETQEVLAIASGGG